VMFIYRDEYYNRESEDPGVAEIHIAKHRNGPSGLTVKLTFLERFPKFASLARSERVAEQPAGEEPAVLEEPPIA